MFRWRKEGKVVYNKSRSQKLCTGKSGKNPSQGKRSKPVMVSLKRGNAHTKDLMLILCFISILSLVPLLYF